MSRTAGDVLHLVFLGAFFVPLGMLILKKLDVDSAAIVARRRDLRCRRWSRRTCAGDRFDCSSRCPSPWRSIGLVLFVARAPLVTDDVAGAQVEIPRKTPVVFLLLDEFPATSLATPAGDIDSVRYPNFARLARRCDLVPERRRPFTRARRQPCRRSSPESCPAGVGCRHLPITPRTSSRCSARAIGCASPSLCRISVPSGTAPARENRSSGALRGLFSDVNVAFLHLVLPSSLKGNLPLLDDRWGDFTKERILAAGDQEELFEAARDRPLSRPQEFDSFLRWYLSERTSRARCTSCTSCFRIRLGASSRRDGPTAKINCPSASLPASSGATVPGSFARRISDISFRSDTPTRWSGSCFAGSSASGLYDEALIVVVADQGVSFIAGGKSRNVSDGEHRGHRSRAVVHQVSRAEDRARRLASGSDDRHPADDRRCARREASLVGGRAVAARELGRADQRRGREGGRDSRTGVAEPRWSGAWSDARVARQSSGRPGTPFWPQDCRGTWWGWRSAPCRQPVAAGARVDFDDEELFTTVDMSSGFVPARITGTIDGIEIGSDLPLVVAVNGRIAASTRSFRIKGKQRFSALVPETAFRDGFNRVELVRISGRSSDLSLTRLGPHDVDRQS